MAFLFLQVMDIGKSFKVGYVAKTHGLKGEFTMVMNPDCPDLREVERVFLHREPNLVPYIISSVSVKGDKAIIKVEGVETIEAATELKGTSVFLPIDSRPKLSRKEFYNDEVIGFYVHDGEQELGAVKDVLEAGPSRFLAVDYNNREVLIPINGPFIKSVNRTKKQITVELPDGFLDI